MAASRKQRFPENPRRLGGPPYPEFDFVALVP
jgi:hypothetical protein